MRKYLKIIAMTAMVAVMTPVAGQAAGNAQVKATCMELANAIATAMAQTDGTHSREILGAFAAGMGKNGGKVTFTDTELLWLAPMQGNPTVQATVYPALRQVRVETKSEALKIYETASAKY